MAFTVTLSAVSGRDVEVGYATSVATGDTAVSGTDFTAATGTLTILAADGTDTGTVEVQTTEDDASEDDETFTLTLSATNNVELGTPSTAMGTITDDDDLPEVTVSFGAASYDAYEGDPGTPATVEVRLSEAPGREVVVPLTAAGMDGAEANDWSAPASVTFAATETSKTFEVSAGDAAGVYDWDPGESVELGFGTLPARVGAGTPATATVVLHNDEGVPVEFSLEVPDDLTISEGGGEVTIVVRTLGNEVPGTVFFEIRVIAIEGDGAIEGYDDNIASTDPGAGSFQILSTAFAQEGEVYVGRKTVSFTAGSSAVGFTVEDDEQDEDDEPFTLSWEIKALEQDIGPDRQYRYAGPREFRMTLAEDDFAPVVGATEFDFDATAGTTAVATLEATDRDLEDAMGGALAWSIRGGADRAKFDLTSAGVLSFKTAPGAADADGDDVYEVTVRVTDGYNPVDADLEVRVVGLPRLSVADAAATEGSAVSFTVTLTEAAAADVTATWTASIGSGDTAGTADFSDLSAAAGTLTFSASASQTTATVTVATREDTLDEEDETFTVTLSGVSSNAGISDATGQGTILDDDDRPTVTVADAMASEGDAVEFVVTLSAVSGRDVTVDYATSVGADDSATSGTDFTSTSGTLTIAEADGTATGTIEVPTSTDAASESAETFTLTISNPMNATLGTDTAATGTIDNRAAGAAAEPTGFEAAPAGDGKVTLSWAPPASGSGITRHEFRYKAGSGSYPATWTQIGNSAPGGANEGSYTVTGLTNEVAHTFQLRAVNAVAPSTAAEAGPVTPRAGICARTQQVRDGILACARRRQRLRGSDRGAPGDGDGAASGPDGHHGAQGRRLRRADGADDSRSRR